MFGKIRHITVPGFKGVFKIPSAILPDDKLVDGLNVICRQGRTFVRPGYTKVGQTLNGKIMGLAVHQALRTEGRSLVAWTPTDMYYYVDGTTSWRFCTPRYYTGTVSVNDSTGVVTLSGEGAAWSTEWPELKYQIRFGTTDMNAAVGAGVTDWLAIEIFNSSTEAQLDGASFPSGVSGSSYVIRRCFSGGEADYFDYTLAVDNVELAKVLIYGNGVDELYYFDGTDSFPLTDSGFTCKFLETYVNMVIAGFPRDGGTQYPQTVWNSDIGDMRQYTPGKGVANIRDLLDEDSWITWLELLRTHMMIYKEKSVIDCVYTGDASEPLQVIENHIYELGTLAGRTVRNVQGQAHLFWANNHNVYLNTGDGAPRPVGEEVVQDIVAMLNRARNRHAHSAVLAELDLYLLFVPSGASDNPNMVYAHNYVEGSWVVWQFAHNMTASTLFQFPAGTPMRFGDYADGIKWADVAGRVGDRADALAQTLVTGDEDGNVYNHRTVDETDAGVPISAYIETKDYVHDTYSAVRSSEARLLSDELTTGSVNVSCSGDSGRYWTTPTTLDLSSDNRMNLSVVKWLLRGAGARVRIENVAGTRFSLHGLVLGITGAGRVIGKRN